MKFIINIIIIQIYLFLPLKGFADYISSVKNSQINWTKGYIVSRVKSSIHIERKGYPVDPMMGDNISINKARLNSYGRAREEAIENLMSAIKTMQIDSDNRMSDIISSERFTQMRLAEAVMQSIRLKEFPADYYSTGCEAKIKFGDIIASLPYAFPANDFPSRDDIILPTDYSGLVIDSRGLALEPMLFPSIYNENGLEIYGRIFIDNKYAYKKGIASYCYNEKEAMANSKSGKNPYFAIALRNLNGCPVLSDWDTRRILGSRITVNNLKKCNVIIILDRKK